jgi:hypothetical protein
MPSKDACHSVMMNLVGRDNVGQGYTQGRKESAVDVKREFLQTRSRDSQQDASMALLE